MHFRILSIHANNFKIIDFAGGIDRDRSRDREREMAIVSYRTMDNQTKLLVWNLHLNLARTNTITHSIDLGRHHLVKCVATDYAQWNGSTTYCIHSAITTFAMRLHFNWWNLALFHSFLLLLYLLVHSRPFAFLALALALARSFLNLIRLLHPLFFKCFVANDEMG